MMADMSFDESRAAWAVVGAMRAHAAAALRTKTGAKTDADMVHAVVRLMTETPDDSRALPFWQASGDEVVDAIADLTGQTRHVASFVVGAALQAQIAAGADVNTTTIRELAERAVAWDRGRAFAEARTEATH